MKLYLILVSFTISVILFSSYFELSNAQLSKITIFPTYNFDSMEGTNLDGYHSYKIIAFEDHDTTLFDNYMSFSSVTSYDHVPLHTVVGSNTYGYSFNQFNTYDLSLLPKSDIFNQVEITSVKLQTMVTIGKAGNTNLHSRIFVTVGMCNDFDISLYQTALEQYKVISKTDASVSARQELTKKFFVEKEINFEAKDPDYCFKDINIDVITVNNDDLPDIFTWDVTEAIIKSIENNQDQLTLKFTARSVDPYKDSQVVIPSYSWASWFDMGSSAVPHIVIEYNVHPSSFSDSIIFALSTAIPTLSILIPAVIWFYKKTSKNTTT